MRQVAALFVQPRSVYRQIDGVDCWDAARDARLFCGGFPVVAHPPRRGWGRLASLAHVVPGELDLARFAVSKVRACGGVLEHPGFSRLWDDQGLPSPGDGRDSFGGFTFPVDQGWFGHRAPKRTWLYVCGVGELPPFPLVLGVPPGRVEMMCRQERERTPVAFARWLVQLARLSRPAPLGGL